MKLYEKILVLVSVSFLSVLFRTFFEPFTGAYLDKIGIYLAAYFLGLYWAILAAVLILIIYLFGFGELLAVMRLPAYLVTAFIIGGVIDIILGRRDLRSGLIEVSWFINTVFIGIVAGFLYSTYSIILVTASFIFGFIFILSYWGKLPSINEFLRTKYCLVFLLIITPITYMLAEFTFYGTIMFNFFSPSVLPYTDVSRAIIAHGGDTALSLIFLPLIVIGMSHISEISVFRVISRSKAKSTALILLITIILLIPSTMYYQSREKALLSIVPSDVDPWELTVVKMDYVWLPLGAHGTNYYYLVPGARSDPNSKYYQAWFGVYWVNGRWYSENDISKVKDYIYKFAIIDQDFWLAQHGDPNPYTAVKEEESFQRHQVNGVEGWLMIGSMYTHSDVDSEAYRNISIKGFFFVTYFPEIDKTAIVYACTFEEYYDSNYDGIRDELFTLLHSLEFNNLLGQSI